ncbi:hypothetical protein ACAW63_10970 [Pseudomonas sp. QE6]|uniref:hypothetical protein n=1 Tax=Pseudomonas sp. QE6 TaxID=3242491 RepID=UPI003527A8B3
MNVSREFLQINQEAGQAIWGIASILEKDAMAVDAGAGRIIDQTEYGCLLSALKLLGSRLAEDSDRALSKEQRLTLVIDTREVVHV